MKVFFAIAIFAADVNAKQMRWPKIKTWLLKKIP